MSCLPPDTVPASAPTAKDIIAEMLAACRLGLRAARHACDHPPTMAAVGARRGCGACRAVVAIEAVIPRAEAALKQMEGSDGTRL